MKRALREKGFIKVFLALAVFASLVFAGISFGTPYYRYFTLSARTADILKGEVGSNMQYIRDKVVEMANELNIPLDAGYLVVTYDAAYKKTVVHATWSETVDILGFYQHQIDFDMKEEL